jgi:crotonobetainyl-CoA:carnitine CoA-transferase CaiB-like acyl-CoA transferase
MESTFSGLRVIECGSFISAAYCAKLLGDLGAEVIKVESPHGGDEARAYGPFANDQPHPERSGLFLYLNTSKLGISLNLETATGQELLRRLLEDADVLVSNYHPRDLARLGLDSGALCAAYPRLIYTVISPFGLTGPNREYRAYDINLCGAGGLSVGVGEPDREPLTLPLSQAEYQAGLSAMGATVVALLARELTGEGQLIDISSQEVIATFFAGTGIANYSYRGVAGVRQGHRASYGSYLRTCLPCKDGYVGITTPQADQWQRFLQVMGNPAWSEGPRYKSGRQIGDEFADELDELICDWLMQHTKEEVFDLCRAARIPCAPVMTAADLACNPNLRERSYFVEIDQPGLGRVLQPGMPFHFSESVSTGGSVAPALGQHNQEVYSGHLGLSQKELVRLRNGGVI